MAPALVVEQLPSSTFVATEDKAQTMSNVEVRSKSTFDELADQIQQNANIISDFLQSNGHPPPSFERNAPTYTLPTSAPSEIRVAREALMGAALQIFQLAAGPSEYLPNVAVGYQYIAALRWLTRFDIFHLVPLTGSITYSDLAASAKVSIKQLKTVVRMAMTNNLFCEPEPNMIAHTATSALLVTNQSFNDWASFMCETSVPMASKLVEASEKWPGSEEKNQTAYNIAFDTDMPFFDHLATLPEKTKQFASYMTNVQNSEGTAIHYLVQGFDWASLGKATVVDVGGSTGAASIALANAFPELNFVVQDLPENARDGQAALAARQDELSLRIFFQGHNFFELQPFKGADIYLLRMILHDWPFREATVILKHLVPALKKTSRIIIMDTVLPQPSSIPAAQERLLRARDMTMLLAFNSLERDLQDWGDLLRAVDERLRVANVVQPIGSVMSVVEVVYEP